MGLFPGSADKRMDQLIEAVFIPFFLAAKLDPRQATVTESDADTPYLRHITVWPQDQDPVTLRWGYTSPATQPALGTIFIHFEQGELQCRIVYYLASKLMDDGSWQYEIRHGSRRECLPVPYTRARQMIGDFAKAFGELVRSNTP